MYCTTEPSCVWRPRVPICAIGVAIAMTAQRFRRLMLPFAVTLVVGFLGCIRGMNVWIVPGSTTSHLVFGVSMDRSSGESIRLTYFSVSPCRVRGGHTPVPIWELTPDVYANYEHRPAVHSVTYGRIVAGFRVTRGPIPLTAGCYYASANGDEDARMGGVKFTVDSSGKVTEVDLSKPQRR